MATMTTTMQQTQPPELPKPPKPPAPELPDFTPQDDSVQNRLYGLMSMSNPLMKQAKTAGLQMANRRGLLNTSMGVGAAQDSMVRAAMPIAQQDAQQAFQKNLSRQDFLQGRNLQGEEIGAREYAQDREIDYQRTERLADRQLQERIASMNLASTDQRAAAGMITGLEGLYADNFRTIMSNPNMDEASRTAQLTSIQRLRDQYLDFVQQMFSIKLEWPARS